MARAVAAYGRLPLRFEANRGQTDSRVKFIARGAGYTLFLTPRESVLSLMRAGPQAQARAGGPPNPGRGAASGLAPSAAVRMRLVGASPRARLTGLTRLAGETNYLIGRNPKGWHTGVPSYATAVSRGVYPGIDLRYHGGQGHLEYDFRVARGADPGRIALWFSGARRLSLDRAGNLVLHTAAGVLRQDRPAVYQRFGGRRRPVSGRFVIRRRHRVGFRLGPYDRSRPLVIDPALIYSTYLGGATGGNNLGNVVAADSSGAAYVAGSTTAIDFPVTSGAYQIHRGNYGCHTPRCSFISNAFVTKISAAGALVYSTYVGGTTGDNGLGIAVGPSGRAYITGTTQSSDFPTTLSAFSRTLRNAQSAFLSVLNASGSALVYSTYLGGTTGTSVGNAVVVDRSGDAYVVGSTTDTDFPTTGGAYQPGPGDTSPANAGDAFVAKFDPSVSGLGSLKYATYLGGSAADSGNGIAVDASGSAYVAGQTSSTDDLFKSPHPPGFQQANAGNSDGFVAKLNPDGSGLDYGTYLGGTGNDSVSGIALDAAGNAYVTGFTNSTNFPTQRAFQPHLPGTRKNRDAFVTKLAPNGRSLAYSSYLGGLGDDIGTGIAVAPAGAANAGTVYVAGSADTIFGASVPIPGSFPTVDPIAPPAVGGDAFVSAVKPDGSGLSFSTYLGGGGEEDVGGSSPGIGGLAVDAGGGVYVSGSTTSTDFPTKNAFQTQNLGNGIGDFRETFVAKLAPVDPAAPLVTGLSRDSGPAGTSVVITGHGFANAGTVQFGTTAASTFTVNADTQITATAPPGAPGAVGVTVITPQGSSPWNPINTFIYAPGTWDLTGALNVARQGGESATLLTNGKVLVAGGLDLSSTPTAAAELYDPASGTWTPTGSLNMARSGHTATLLPGGDVLVVGGVGSGGTLASAELYDPASGTWSATGAMTTARANHTATLLSDGRVLVAGGTDSRSTQTTSAELYDPTSGTWRPAGTLADARSEHTATLLLNGDVLVVGGARTGAGTTGAPLASAELYDPTTNSWATTSPLSLGRSNQTATRLPDGRVLIAGGQRGVTTLASAEVYDPRSEEFGPAGAMAEPRTGAAATLLPDGSVLVAGGNVIGNPLNTAEVYDPASGQWGSAGVMNRYRGLPFAVGLSTGQVLVGGDSQTGGIATELFTPGAPPGSPGPGPGSGPGPGFGPSAAAPIVTHYRLTNYRFVVGSARTPVTGVAAAASKHKHATRHRRGTTFKYMLSEAATVRIVISRRLPGRRKGRSCIAPSRKLRHAKRCVRIIAKGTLTRTSRQGANKIAFSGRIGARTLKPGSYQAALTATDAAKLSSKPHTLYFTIVRR